MKIAVISDTHGKIEECIAALKLEDNLDLIIHLGDYVKDAIQIKEILKINMINIKGNCDLNDTSAKDEEILEYNDKRIFLTHGHKYGVKHNLNRLYYRGEELKVDAVLFGHSHTPLSIIEDKILLFNPGSITSPRGIDKKSYGIIEINNDIKAKIVYV